MKYEIEVTRTIANLVEVEADTPKDALNIVMKRDYPLPLDMVELLDGGNITVIENEEVVAQASW